MRRLRLAFLTSRQVTEIGGTKKLFEEIDFGSMLTEENEATCIQFMIDVIGKDLRANFKPTEVYE